jgi:hypothetical protein
MDSLRSAAAVLGLSLALPGCAHLGLGKGGLPPGEALTSDQRRATIRRAEVWSATDIPSLDLRAGPSGEGGFPPDEWVTCDYKKKKLSGATPKFACEVSPDDEAKVKYGPENGEVFSEVLSTRLFWALGFAVDRMYPVRVRCRGCSADPWRDRKPRGKDVVTEFDPAAIERKLPGRAMESKPDSGWKWSELELIDPDAGPEARAHRDALKLLAAFVQHSDNKASQQRLVCPEGKASRGPECARPILAVSDLGVTFGRATLFNKSKKGAVNFVRWSTTPVWKDRSQCIAQLKKSFTGSLGHPRISEAGRAFLAGLLVQLSNDQLRDLFGTARVEMRPRDPRKKRGPPATVDEWVAAFKRKRDEIVENRCPQ